jgi:hypothetical protein
MKLPLILLTMIFLLSPSLVFSNTSKTCPKTISEKAPFVYEGCSGEACGHIEKCNEIKNAKFFTSVISSAGSGVIISTPGSGKI